MKLLGVSKAVMVAWILTDDVPQDIGQRTSFGKWDWMLDTYAKVFQLVVGSDNVVLLGLAVSLIVGSKVESVQYLLGKPILIRVGKNFVDSPVSCPHCTES